MCFLKYNLQTPSVPLGERLAMQESILLIPGALCGMEYHLRLSYALPPEIVTEGLGRLIKLLRKVEQEERATN